MAIPFIPLGFMGAFLFALIFSAPCFSSEQKQEGAFSSEDLLLSQVSEADSLKDSPSAPAPEVGDVTPHEEVELQRRVVPRKYAGLGFGPAQLRGLSTSELCYLFQAAYYWEVQPWAAIKIKTDHVFDFSRSESRFFSNAGIGTNFFLTRTNVSPFAGFDFGFGYAKKPDFDGEAGFVLGGSLGVALFRPSTTQFMLDLNIQTMFKKIEGRNPGKLSLGASILF